MRKLRENSISAIITDPPYGPPAGAAKGFMGLAWDTEIAFRVDVWREALRVLKPGGYLLAFGGTRTHHRLTVAIEDAGFEIRDCLVWMYGQGMPKGKNVLKPAWEPVVMARKPGSGGLNIERCRVGAPQGRWPANLMHDGSGEVLEVFPNAPGQLARASTGLARRKTQRVYGAMLRGSNGAEPRGDTGSAARFFWCPKAAKKDRGPGNDWPTVKPTELMRYLCRLVTPEGGVVLDPFTGSGSTGKAAVLEGLHFIGFDSDPHAVEIAKSRLSTRTR